MTSISTRQFEGMLPERPGRQIVPGTTSGCATSWDDGMTTYTLQWGPAAAGVAFGWMMADELDTALMALEAIRAGDVGRLRDKHFLMQTMSHVRKLRLRLEAIEEELLRQARDEDPTGSATLSWRDAGDELRQHHTSVRERWQRSMTGQHAEYRHWLVQGLNETDTAPAAEGDQHIDPARRARIAEVLFASGALIQRNGWSRNKHYDHDAGKAPAESPLGLVGAIAMVLCGDPVDWEGPVIPDDVPLYEVQDYLRDFLDAESLAGWNNAPGRTQGDVVKALREAAEALANPEAHHAENAPE